MNVLILTTDAKEFDDVLEEVSVYRVFLLAAAKQSHTHTPPASTTMSI